MTVIDKAEWEKVTQIVFENYGEFLRLAFERDGFAGVIELSDRLVCAAKEFGYGNGTPTDDVVALLLGKLFPQIDRDLYKR